MTTQPKRLLFMSTRAGVGLSSIVKGLLVSLRETGVSVKVDILGDSLLEATHIRRTTGRLCQSLAPNFLTKEQILFGYGLSLNGCELHILLCEDSNFITDNLDLLAKLDPVVVLVFDGEKDLSNDFEAIRALATKLNRDQSIGLIGNFSDLDYSNYQSLVETDKFKILGLIPRFEDGKFAGGSSLSVNRNPSLLTRNQILRLRSLVETYIKFNEFRELCKLSRDVDFAKEHVGGNAVCRIAIADDSAFHLTFQDNITLLKQFGAELKLFSPLIEHSLPEGIDAIYFTNSYFGLYAEEIEQNKKLINQIKERIYSGVLAYFEGDSTAYACSKVILEDGKVVPMLGVVNCAANLFENQEYTKDRYLRTTFIANSESLITTGDEKCVGFYSNEIRLDLECKPIFKLPEINDYNIASAGITTLSNIFCNSSILHWGSNPKLAANFIARARTVGASDLSMASLKAKPADKI